MRFRIVGIVLVFVAVVFADVRHVPWLTALPLIIISGAGGSAMTWFDVADELMRLRKGR